MSILERMDLQGKVPTVEFRSWLNLYFVCYDQQGVELATAFANKWAAYEVAANAYYGVPFFTLIPAVEYGTDYPRPGTIVPKTPQMEIKLRVL